jgi:hypothetical protein
MVAVAESGCSRSLPGTGRSWPSSRPLLAEFPATAALTPSRRADDRFDEFVLAIAGELSARKLIDYRVRRMALLDWELDEQTWQHLVADARGPTADTCR